jgi:hypothetical protein
MKEIRAAAGLSITAAAALADVAPHTWKVFELNADAVKDPEKRAACEAALQRMRDGLRATTPRQRAASRAFPNPETDEGKRNAALCAAYDAGSDVKNRDDIDLRTVSRDELAKAFVDGTMGD